MHARGSGEAARRAKRGRKHEKKKERLFRASPVPRHQSRGHLRVSRFAWQTTEKRETARSLPNGWLLNHVHLLLMNVFTHSSICFAWMFPFFTNVCMIQWKSLSSSVKTLFSFYLLFLSKIYSFLFDWVCCWGRKNTNTCYEIILHERCNALSRWWVSAVYLVFFTLLFLRRIVVRWS